MQINSINNNISFGRIVKIVNTNAHPNSKEQKNNTQDIISILKNLKVKKYSKEETAKIKNFFAGTLEDYNGKNEILYRTTKKGDNVLISGKDAIEILKMEIKQRKKINRLNKKIDMPERQKISLADKSYNGIDSYINRRIEDGKGQKLNTCFYISSSNPKGKIDKFNYTQKTMLYSAEIDGHFLTAQEQKKHPECKLQIAGVDYRSERLDLNA